MNRPVDSTEATMVGLSTMELRRLLQKAGYPAYRGEQVAQWLYHKGVHNAEDMTTLPTALRAHLSESYRIGRSRLARAQRSSDGTLKLLLEEADGARVETVGLPYEDRISCCVSTQVGCPIGCVFCATGLSGFSRNLSAGEILDQVLLVQEQMTGAAAAGGRSRVDHVIFMGMGEPLLNYDSSLKAVRLLNSEMGIAMRRLTISTVGLVPGIRRLAAERLQLTLAVSLHAPTDELRQRLIPGAAQWTVTEILAACRDYIERTGRRVTFEYCLLAGINDADAEAEELSRVLHGLNCHVNLIVHNAVAGLGFRAPSRDRVLGFRGILESAGIQVTQRMERGSDIDAACGQLRRRFAAEPATGG